MARVFVSLTKVSGKGGSTGLHVLLYNDMWVYVNSTYHKDINSGIMTFVMIS